VPLLIHISTRELLVEVIKNRVDIHALSNFLLKFSYGDRNFRDVLLGLGKFLNVFGDSSDALIDLIKLCLEIIVQFFCLLSNQLNFLINNLSVLANIHVADVLAIDLENGYIYKLGNLSAETIFLLAVLVHVILKALSSNGSVTFVETFNKAVRVQLVFSFKLLECLNVLVERLNGSLEISSDSVVCVPEPDVLIW
jgi:hypothetical protein